MLEKKWTVVTFGKFAGKRLSLSQIVLTDSDWFRYMAGKKASRGRLLGNRRNRRKGSENSYSREK